MDYSEKWGKSVDAAVELALKDLKLTIDEVDVEVLEEPNKGFLGLGSKLAKVRVVKKGVSVDEQLSAGDQALEEVRQEVTGAKAAVTNTENAAEDKAEAAESAASAETAAEGMEAGSAFGAAAAKEEKPERMPDYGVIDLRSKGDKPAVQTGGGRDRGRGRRDRDRDRGRGGRSDAQLSNVNTEAISVKPEDLIPVEAHEALDFLRETTKNMGLNLTVSAEANDEFMYITLEGEDAGAIIGKRGQTLDAIQYLTSLVVNKEHEDYIRVVVDAENYRAKREKTLQQLAIRLGTKVLRTGRPVKLEPMNPYERMVIHATLSKADEVTTISEGEEPYRRVIIEKQ